jgi:anti-sigma B factor antagonist
MIDFFESEHLPNGITVVKLSGQLDAESADYFFSCMTRVIDAGHRRIIVDCGRLAYLSSLGVGVLVRSAMRLRKCGGDIKLAGVGGTVVKVLEVVGLDRLLRLYPTVLDAQYDFPPAASPPDVPGSNG